MMLTALIHRPLSEAIGWTILHSLWQGVLLAAMLGVVLLLTRSPRVRYGAACTALLLLALGFALTLDRLAPQGRAQLSTVAPGTLLENPGTVSGAPPSWDFTVSALAPWLTPLWMAGVVLFYLRGLAGLIGVARLRRRGVSYAPADWQTRVTALSAKLHLARPVRLLESCFVEIPMVIGYLRPVILVPLGMLTGFPAAQIEAVILHELAHVRRRDYLFNALQRVVEGLLFYHPAAWWISQIIRSERENCCDDIAVSAIGEVHEYATVLAALEERRWTATEWAVTATGGSLVKRIRRLLYPQNPKTAWTPFLAAVLCLITIAFGLGAWQSNRVAPPSTDGDRRMELGRFLMKSMNEGAAYTLVNEEERATYVKLGTDEERMHFIMQFWLSRNPATSMAEIHNEIDRRIAYADQHFQTAAGLAGSQADRGRMYVVYGPPDEIESHPTEGREQWTYHSPQAPNGTRTFTFVDATRTGDYRLTLQPAPQG